MTHAWDVARFPDVGKHKTTSRRRWSDDLRSRVDYPWSSKANVNVIKLIERVGKAANKAEMTKVSKKDSAEAAKSLQLQVENFFRTLELQSLRSSVTDLLGARNKAEESFHLFKQELKNLELGLEAAGAVERALDYELSEQDWLSIMER